MENTSPKRKRADISEDFRIPRLRVGLVFSLLKPKS